MEISQYFVQPCPEEHGHVRQRYRPIRAEYNERLRVSEKIARHTERRLNVEYHLQVNKIIIRLRDGTAGCWIRDEN